MMGPVSLIERDLKHIWHPCSQMKDYAQFQPLVITKASGSYIELENGQRIIDAISSWWCKSLGHNHPRLRAALLKQINLFEHVLLANMTNETIILLAEKLARLTSTLHKSFFAGDGSSTVEIAMKMSLHSRVVCGEHKKKRFIALENSYHGETTGALSVSDIGIYKSAYQSMLFDVHFIAPVPYVSSVEDALWKDCSLHWNRIEKSLEPFIESTTAIIVEPIVQGAAGMKVYSQDFLKRLRLWCTKHNIHLIADEIMTGIGRTGKMLACQHANIEPDFICLGKGITSGWLPFSVVMTSDEIYQHFYDDYEKGTAFLHSHTYSGNALGVCLALEVLTMAEEMKFGEMAERMGTCMLKAMRQVAAVTGKITNIRHVGAIIAADLICDEPGRRLGFEVYQQAICYGALLRPIGNTIYWVPPLNTGEETIEELKTITIKALCAV